MSPRLKGYRERIEDDIRYDFHVPPGDIWVAVRGRERADQTRVICDVIVSTSDVSVELSRPSQQQDGTTHRQVLQGPWFTLEGRQSSAIAADYRAIYQAGVDASGVEREQLRFLLH